MPTGSRQEKAALEAAIDRVTRLAKELRSQDLSGIQERWDPRIEAVQKRINNALGDVLGLGSPEYKALKVGGLESTLDTSFGDRYSTEELHDSIRKGLDGAIANLNEAAKVLDERLHGGAFAGARPAAAAPAPTAAPTQAPTAPPTPAPTPKPVAPTPAPTANPAPPATPAPTKAPAVAGAKPSPPRSVAATIAARAAAAAAEAPNKPSKTPMPSSDPSSSTAGARHVAIVSSIGDKAAASVADYVRQLGLEAIVVGDAPISDDMAIVDRLEAVRGCDYAVVLAAASALAAEPSGHGARAETLLEAGFLFGLLGRRKVCYLLEGKAILAPELRDVVRSCTRDEADLWHLLLAREMRKAGLDVDMNRAV